MKNWAATTTSELIASGFLEIGDGYRAKNDELSKDGLPFARAQNVNGGFLFDGADRYPISELHRVGPKVSEPGDCVITTKGSVGRVGFVTPKVERFVYSPQLSYWRSRDEKAIVPRFLCYWLQGPEFLVQCAAVKGSTDMADYVNLHDQRRLRITLPPPAEQRRIGDVLGAIDDLIENNRQRIALLERMALAIYREWFVRFRYPGHEDDELVGSPLGPIPSCWAVRPLAELASSDRHAITSGPFGSKLGRKDYVPDGVPVIRGSNLRIGGGFDTTDVVFVSEGKADELASSLARPGDVVVTQRGTLGQVGLIPSSSRWPRYVLSQSQMKVTVDRTSTTAEFIYCQLRSNETTERFVAQSMTSGVPHVNLALLREFEVLAPPLEMAVRFSYPISAFEEMQGALSTSSSWLASVRDLLLPKLVTGALDISALDIDGLFEESAA